MLVAVFQAPQLLTLVEQLRALARVSEHENRFDILYRGRVVHVHFSPGSTDSLDISTDMPAAGAVQGGGYRDARRPVLVAPRPLGVTLRKETSADRGAKREGINREVETGDAAFDAAVYVDSQSEDHVLLTLLASPEVRGSAMALLESDCRSIQIDHTDGRINLPIIEFLSRTPDQQRAARIVHNLVCLAEGLPAVQASGAPAPTNPACLPVVSGCVLAFAGMIGVPILYMANSPGKCMESDEDGTSLVCSAGLECCTPGAVGTLIGAGIALPLLLVVLPRLIRGRSDSSTWLLSARVALFCVLVEIGVLISRFVL
jgi:hypothetical protein